MGYSYGVPDLAKASMAFGCDGILVEVHPTPAKAKSDASQQLDFPTFKKLMNDLQIIGGAVGKRLV
jgi:3-deoxy-7-phosphoheptulonate synthase